jgi:hypothetical protein
MAIPPSVYPSSSGVFTSLAPPPPAMTAPVPSFADPQVNQEKHNGLRAFQIIKIGLMSIVGAFTMNIITHSSFRQTLPLQLLLNSLEAMAVTALYKDKIPFVNDLIEKIYSARHRNDPQKTFKNSSAREKERALPYMAALVTALAGVIQMAVSMKQGKMRDETLQPVSQQKLLQNMRRFSKNMRVSPKQGLQHIQRLMPVLNQYIQGLAPFRVINRSPALAILLTCVTSAFFGFVEAKAATAIADTVRDK